MREGLQYILASLGFLATILGITAGIFPKAKKSIASLAFLVACGVLVGNYFSIKNESISEKEARCERDMRDIIGIMSVKRRVVDESSRGMVKTDTREIDAINRKNRITHPPNSIEYLENLHNALGSNILSEHLGDVDTTFIRYIRYQTKALDNISEYGCGLEWNEPPDGMFACKCKDEEEIRF